MLATVSRLVEQRQEPYYKARMGACFGSTGVFWLEIHSRQGPNRLLVRNVGGGKKRVKQITASLEDELVYPLLRGRDLRRWAHGSPLGVLMPQDSSKRSLPMRVSEMKTDYPLTWRYLKQFESLLRGCGILQQFYDPRNDPFYALYNVGEYTYAPWKVLWRQVSNSLDTVVVGKQRVDSQSGPKPVIPDHSLCSISFMSAAEAHYVAALLNSVISRYIVKNYCALHPSPHIMEYIPIQKFTSKEPLHERLAKLSSECHNMANKQNREEVESLESKIDVATAELWGITLKELQQIQQALKER